MTDGRTRAGRKAKWYEREPDETIEITVDGYTAGMFGRTLLDDETKTLAFGLPGEPFEENPGNPGGGSASLGAGDDFPGPRFSFAGRGTRR